MDYSEKEVLRYLGYGATPPDERILSLIGAVAEELGKIVSPKSVFEEFSLSVNQPELNIGGVKVVSESLSQHLSGCEIAVLFAATIGVGADTLIRRYSITDMEKAAIAQAVSAAALEAYCDRAAEEIAAKYTPELYPKPRFSPGYGDFSMEHQKDITGMLLTEKRIGLTLTGGFMLAPSKSVTAVIGFSGDKSCNANKCRSCGNLNCAFRNVEGE